MSMIPLLGWTPPIPIIPIPEVLGGYPRRPVYLKSKKQRRSIRCSYRDRDTRHAQS